MKLFKKIITVRLVADKFQQELNSLSATEIERQKAKLSADELQQALDGLSSAAKMTGYRMAEMAESCRMMAESMGGNDGVKE